MSAAEIAVHLFVLGLCVGGLVLVDAMSDGAISAAVVRALR